MFSGGRATETRRYATPNLGHSALADHLGWKLCFDDLIAFQGDVVDAGLLARFHDPTHLVVDEVDAGVVVAGVAGLEFARADQPMVGGPTHLFRVVVRRMTSAKKPQALDLSDLLRPGVGCALLEPTK